MLCGLPYTRKRNENRGTSLADDAVIEEPEPAIPVPRRRRTWLRVGGGAAAIGAALLGGLWIERKPIAIHFIAQALRDKGVAATYDITRIGPRTQRIEHLVLGDPARPDLTADWIEVDLGYGLSGVRVAGLRTGHVAVNARYHEGRLDLGQLDRLIPKGGGGKTELPDIDAAFKSVAVRLKTDGGMLDLALNGAGNLRSGFLGALSAGGPKLALGGCTIDALSARTSVASSGGRMQFKGPVSANAVACGDRRFLLAAPRIDADLRTDPALAKINGAFALSAAGMRQGERMLARLSGLVTADGSLDELHGSAALAAAGASLGVAEVAEIKLGGNYAVRPQGKDQDYSYAASLTAKDVRPAATVAWNRLVEPVAGTPVEPLARKLVAALRDAASANSLSVGGRVSGEGGAMQLLVNGMQFASASGAHVAMQPDSKFSLLLPKGTWTLDGGLEMRGGGLPEGRLAMAARPEGGFGGMLTMADYRAGSARLAMKPLRFVRSANGTFRVNTAFLIDGPLGSGSVTGLQAPLDLTLAANGKVTVPRDCVAISWAAMRISTLALDPARLNLCGLGGAQMRLDDTSLHGRMGESPFRLALQSARLDAQSLRFDLTGVDTRIGAGENPVLLSAATLSGAVGKGGALAGTFDKGSAVIATVPLNLSAIAGQWTFKDAVLAVDGGLRVSDRQADPGVSDRFNPLDMKAGHLTLANGRITADGMLVHPDRKVNVATIRIDHDLGSGIGQADFALAGLRFGSAIQPQELTPMAQGVVQLVQGPLEGSGSIRWSSEGVTSSTGTFSTPGIDFAGAFGPVQGLATTIHFTDLLNLTTAPHQRLTVRKVSPGVDVFDGVIDYALLSKDAARIEGGRWPFSGGTLELLPATLNLDSRQPRQFTFRVVGLDAAAFVNTLQLENLNVRGTLDGLLPMIFDTSGGRIEGGLLVARQQGLPPLVLASPADPLPSCDVTRQGGSLAYVGAVSNAQLGTMGSYAFDALKHFDYRCLVVRLDGALDGEFVTQIRLNGINQSADAKHSWLVRPFLKLPIIFNLRIEAPFRELLGAYTNIYTANAEQFSKLIENEKAKRANDALAVQPAESENKTEGNVK